MVVLVLLASLRRVRMLLLTDFAEHEDAAMHVGRLWINILVHLAHVVEELFPCEGTRLAVLRVIGPDVHPMHMLPARVVRQRH